jgi:hypothetical protein
MARGLLLTEDDAMQIRLIWQRLKKEQRRVTAEDVRRECERLMGRKIGLSTVQRELAKKPKEDDPLFGYYDRIWSMGSVARLTPPLPPQLMPVLLALQDGIADHKMSIRQALWVVRLYGVYYYGQDVSDEDDKNKKQRMKELWGVSMLYAEYERICDSRGVICNTSHLDHHDPKVLRKRVLEWFKDRIPIELYWDICKQLGVEMNDVK